MKRLLALVLAGFLAAPLFAAEMREWTDTKGRKVSASMVGMKDGKVLLRMSTGKIIPFPLQLLSEADQKFARKNAPPDASTAVADIDRMVLEKLKAAYLKINEDLDKTKKTPVSASFPVKDKIKAVEDLEFLKRMTYEQLDDPLSDEQFVRRIYLDIAGRIPTYQETVAFLDDRDRSKRSKLIDQLLDSEAFASNFFNFLSDLLRIRDGIGMNGINGLPVGAYADWTKDQIRQNTPWNQWVKEMIAAEGHYWDNPATGYMLTDQGMQLCNLSNTFTVFAGTEITCAQCHDHPFEEVYQLDFYKMAAFTSGLNTRAGGSEMANVARTKLREYQAEHRKRNAGKTPMPRFDRQLQDILGSYSYVQGDRDEGSKGMVPTTKLPHDYKYDDAEPHQQIKPSAYMGEIVNLEEHESARDAFAAWMTGKENPRFTINIVNRLWKQVFGMGQIEPVYNIPGDLAGQAQNVKLLMYMEQLMKDLNFDIKAFLRILYNTKTYQREANHFSPTLAQIDKGEYHFAAPILRRMTAEQIWDSMVSLTTDTPEAYQKRILDDYRQLMNTSWENRTFDDAMKFKEQFRAMGGGGMMMGGGGNRGGRVDPLTIRASEMRLPERAGHLLFSFGQSDKLIIENANKVGSVPQVMFMLNGDLTNKQLIREESAVVKNCKAAGGQSKGIEVAFLSILNRKPNSEEAQTASKLVEGDDFSDLIWALANSREFMFVQ